MLKTIKLYFLWNWNNLFDIKKFNAEYNFIWNPVPWLANRKVVPADDARIILYSCATHAMHYIEYT